MKEGRDTQPVQASPDAAPSMQPAAAAPAAGFGGIGMAPALDRAQVLRLQGSAGNQAVARLLSRTPLLRDELSTPAEQPAEPNHTPGAPDAGGETCEEDAYEFTWNGETYQIPESEWPAFSAEAAQLLADALGPGMELKLEDLQEAYARFRENEDAHWIGPFIVHGLWKAPSITEYSPRLSVAQARVADVGKTAAVGDLAGTCATVAEAEAAINDAVYGIQDYLFHLHSDGASAIRTFEVVQTAAFAAFSVAAGAALVPLGMSVAMTGAVSAGGTAFLQGVVNVSADVAVGPNQKTAWENVKSVAIGTMLNAAGGAAGGAIADRIKGPLIDRLVRLHQAELQQFSQEVQKRIVFEATESFAGGLGNVVQSVIADVGAAATGEMTFEEFEKKVVSNMVANGIGGAIMGVAGGRTTQYSR